MEGLEPALASVPACLTDHDYLAIGVSQKSSYSVSTPGPRKIIRVYRDSISKPYSLLPSASAKHIVEMSLVSNKGTGRLFKVSRLSSDTIQVPVKRKTTLNSLSTSASSNFDATSTPVPATVVVKSSESIADLSSHFVSKSTPRSIEVIDLSFDSISASASMSDSTGPAKAIGENVPIAGSLDDAILPSVSMSTLDAVRERISQSRKAIEIVPKVSPSSYSLLGQCRIITSKKDSPNMKDKQTNLSANNILKPRKEFVCSICGMIFSYSNSLYRHMSRKHPADARGKLNRVKLKCPECPHFEGYLYKELIQHMNCMHNKHMKVLYNDFPSEEKFEQWKLDMERETCSKFVLTRGAQQTADNKMKAFYYCHRSGTSQISQTRKRKVKAQGSSKIGSRCTAYIKKSTDMTDKTVYTEYCLDHFGHDFNPAHQPISKDLKRTIAKKLTEGVDPWDILKDMKAQKLKGHRDAMLTIKDIHNIKKNCKILCSWTKEKAYICSICNLQAKSRGGLHIHKSKKHHQSFIAFNKAGVTNDFYKADESTAEPDLHDENKDLEGALQLFEKYSDNMEQSSCREEKANPSELVQVKDSIIQTLQDLKQTVTLSVVKTKTISVLKEIDKQLSTIRSFALESL